MHCVQKKYRILQGRQTALGWRWNRLTSSLEALDFEVALTVSGPESVFLCTECFSIPFLSQVQLEVTGSLRFRASDQSWPFLLSKLPPSALVDNNNNKKMLFILFSSQLELQYFESKISNILSVWNLPPIVTALRRKVAMAMPLLKRIELG